MPNYLFVCADEHRTELWRSIHARMLRIRKCETCGRTARLTMTAPAIAAAALPNKLHAVTDQLARDKQFEQDHPAYARLRSNGLQPRGIDGCAAAESQANSAIEIEMGRPLGKPKDIRRAQEITSELMQKDVTDEGQKIGAAKRGTP